MSSDQVGITDSVTDSITPAISGGAWLQADGSRIPVTATATAYYSADKPVLSESAPDGAEVVGTSSAVLTGPGSTVVSNSIPVGSKAGWVTIQWCITDAAQPAELQGLVSEWCDQYGVLSETAQVVGPTVTTKAQPASAPGDTVTDTALVDGPIPSAGLDVTFSGYLRPEGSKDESQMCGPDQLAYSSASPIVVTKDGEYTSEKFPVTKDQIGTINWIEKVTIHGTDIVVHEGQCNMPNEQSEIAQPTVTTKAVSTITLGDKAHDTAIVDKWVAPGTTLVFHLYKWDETQAVCTIKQEVYNSAAQPVAVTAGWNDKAEYVSPDFVPTEAGNYGYVEELIGPDHSVIHRGDCGETSEGLVVNNVPPTPVAPAPPAPPAETSLAETGTNGPIDLLVGGLALAAMLAGATVWTLTLRRKEKQES